MPLRQVDKFVLLTQRRLLHVQKMECLSNTKWNVELVTAIDDILRINQMQNSVSILLGPARQEFTRGQQQQQTRHIITMCLPKHETLEFSTTADADQFLSILHLVEHHRERLRTTLLISTWSLQIMGYNHQSKDDGVINADANQSW